MRLNEIATPALILDLAVLRRNLETMSRNVKARGANLRPHMKTAKCVEIARMATAGHTGAITVSTLREAAYFLQHGFTDITYAVGIAPDKLHAVSRLQQRGATLHILTDSLDAAHAIAARSREGEGPFSVFIEIDSGYGRSGALPESDELIALGRALNDAPGVHLHGVLTHAGHSYKAADDAARTKFADEEAGAVIRAANQLREAGIPCPVVSAGSTPTSVAGRTVQGVNEERPGNYMFYDLMMAGRGVCAIEDIAVSVLTTVVASKPERNHALVDAGILAMSKDLGADDGPMPGVRFGLVRDLHNTRNVGDAVVANLSQEQGWIASRSGGALPMDALAVGAKIRVLPNHSCITCAAYERYYVLDGGDEVVGEWPRVNGW